MLLFFRLNLCNFNNTTEEIGVGLLGIGTVSVDEGHLLQVVALNIPVGLVGFENDLVVGGEVGDAEGTVVQGEYR